MIIVTIDSSLLYLNLDASLLSDQLQQHFQSQNVHIRPYDQFFSDLQMMLKDSSMKVLIDPGTTNDAIWRYRILDEDSLIH